MVFERLIAELAAGFVSVAPEDIDALIVDGQRRLVEELDLDRCALWQFTEDQEDLVLTHAWIRPELPQLTLGISARDSFPWYIEQIRANAIVANATVDEIPSAVDRLNMRRLGGVSAVVIPLSVSGRSHGALTFGSMRRSGPWEPDLLDRFHLVGTVFAQGLVRRETLVQLQVAAEEIERLRERLASEGVHLRDEARALDPPPTIAAGSEAVRRSLELVAVVAPTDASVLLHGETGSGKEVFAQEIHRLSPRSDRTMVRVNCAAIPTALLESELFGRERGAYTGALSRQAGRFELANGTTIFLDEIGDLPLDAQAKLLRVLQERKIERLGGTKSIDVDVRVIAATNRDLAREVAARTFREDLFYRLNVFPIVVPPLRERVEDISDLAWTFIEEFSQAFNKRIDSISRESIDALKSYWWPGNVRELRNLIERAVIMATGPHLVVELPASPLRRLPEALSLFEVEAGHIRGVLERVGWRVRGAGGAAEILRMNPTTLDSRMAKLGIRRPAKPSRAGLAR